MQCSGSVDRSGGNAGGPAALCAHGMGGTIRRSGTDPVRATPLNLPTGRNGDFAHWTANSTRFPPFHPPAPATGCWKVGVLTRRRAETYPARCDYPLCKTAAMEEREHLRPRPIERSNNSCWLSLDGSVPKVDGIQNEHQETVRLIRTSLSYGRCVIHGTPHTFTTRFHFGFKLYE
jgi:hypothetical protein